ncbi:hypothetical protein [Beduini massiliensis]|uniref:hypothetical protein n=1 Tax=Beduini massiliensis TaxID=1585974 RepID=UPI00059AB503|nr:hypothetical protein [Beduini massiliensis]
MMKILSVLGITSLLGGGAVIYALNQPLSDDAYAKTCQVHTYHEDCQNWVQETVLSDENDPWQCPYGNETCMGSESCTETCYNDEKGCHQNDTTQHHSRSMHHQRQRR